MAKKTETITPREAIRKGWLAYIGMYGAAYDRATQVLTGKGAEIFEEFVAKGEEVEDRAQDAVESFRERANINTERFSLEGLRNMLPAARKSRVEDLEAEIEALNKKVASLSKKKTAKRTTKKAA